MANPNILDPAVRRKLIGEIKGAENQARKRNEQRKFDIYRKRQAPYVIERLQDEFDAKTVKAMRKVLSINPCKRIIDEQSSLYVEEPDRHFTNANDAQIEQLEEIYECSNANPQLRLANRYYKLHGQSSLYVLPRDNKIICRALTPKDYDVIPDADDPEKAFAYILNVFDKDMYGTAPGPASESKSAPSYNYNDRMNQNIADNNDARDRLGKERYVFWTDEVHLTCDGMGEIVDDMLEQNPIGELPFIDIANEKDFRFFVQLGSDVAEFVIDLLTQLSDLANTVRFQNYSQAIIYSVNQPTNLTIGPSKVLWLQVDPNADQGTRPEFSFVNPTPDIMGSLELINVQLKMFLSSHGLNPGTVSGKNELEKFTSGIDHLLSNLDKFKASKEDMDIFRSVEQKLFDLFVLWHGVMYDVTGEMALDDEYKIAQLNEEIDIVVSFKEPHAVQTQSEVEDSVIKLVQSGLMTKLEAVRRIYDVDEIKAQEMVDAIQMERQARIEENMSKGLDEHGKPLPPKIDPETGKPIPHGQVVIDESGKDYGAQSDEDAPDDQADKGKKKLPPKMKPKAKVKK